MEGLEWARRNGEVSGMSTPSPRALVAFVRSVSVLALDAAGQLAWLASLGLPGTAALADELALEFDDGFKLLPTFISLGWIQPEAADALAELDATLARMSDPSQGDVWKVEALTSDVRWEGVRSLARDALLSFG